MAISRYDKYLNAKAFIKPKAKKTKYTIFKTTNMYEIGIDNLYIECIIQ